MTESAKLMTELEEKYCPPLDTATFLSIISDFDISKEDDLELARQILDSLKESADFEEATGFDPSGSGGGAYLGDDHSNARSESGVSGPGWSSNTEDTSLSLEAAGRDLEESYAGNDGGLHSDHDAHFEGLDMDSKEAVLIETFPALKPFDVKWTLKKCKGNAGLAIDELLNQSFLEETGGRHKGIEAFSETDRPASRKGNGKGRKTRARGSAVPSIQAGGDGTPKLPIDSKWDQARTDIDFISTRTGVPTHQASSLYHQNGGSLKETINALIDANTALGIDNQDYTTQQTAQDLARNFPTIPLQRLISLVQLTAPSPSSARDLATALITRSITNGKTTPIQIEFRLPPPDLSDGTPSVPKQQSHNAVFSSEQEAHFNTDLPNNPESTQSSASYINLRNSAFNQASNAYRRGKSDHLMAGAAAYYASLGHDFNARAKSASASEFDRIAASQSTSTSLDLHGIDVKNAVRISREGVTNWWSRNQAGGGRGNGSYKIVTGRGTHSEGGRGKLGPAVGTMLIREGWKVEVGSGVLAVTGVVVKRS